MKICGILRIVQISTFTNIKKISEHLRILNPQNHLSHLSSCVCPNAFPPGCGWQHISALATSLVVRYNSSFPTQNILMCLRRLNSTCPSGILKSQIGQAENATWEQSASRASPRTCPRTRPRTQRLVWGWVHSGPFTSYARERS